MRGASALLCLSLREAAGEGYARRASRDDPRASRLVAFHEAAHAVAVIHVSGQLVGCGVRIAGDYVAQASPMSLPETDFTLIHEAVFPRSSQVPAIALSRST
jgi:ATP-dependent Zn protease